MNPKHKPTPQHRKTVKAMLGFGIKQDDVARVIGISDVTLRLYYGTEIATAEVEANAQVTQSLFLNATKHRNVTAQIWWTKTRMGWKETVRIGGEPGGAAVVLQVISGVDRGEAKDDAED